MSSRSGRGDPRANGDIDSLPPPHTAPVILPPPDPNLLRPSDEEMRLLELQQHHRDWTLHIAMIANKLEGGMDGLLQQQIVAAMLQRQQRRDAASRMACHRRWSMAASTIQGGYLRHVFLRKIVTQIHSCIRQHSLAHPSAQHCIAALARYQDSTIPMIEAKLKRAKDQHHLATCKFLL